VVTEPTAEKATNKAPRSIVTLTLTGVPVSLNGQLSLADAIVTVDFADLAARRIGNAVSSPRKTSLMLGGAIVVQATNLRAWPTTPVTPDRPDHG
jgi:hypothetical protein